MDRINLGAAAALSALIALPGAAGAAAPTAPPVAPAQSYAELLDPIPDAAARLQLADAQEPESAPRLIEAQYVVAHHHHHHHWRRHHHRHHHDHY